MPTGDPSTNVVRVVWGALLIWIGVALLLRFGWGVGLLGAGVILIAAQVARRYLQLKVDGFGLVAGLVLVLCGVGNMVHVAVSLFPILFIVAGVALLVSLWTTRGARGTPGGPADLSAHSHPRP